MRVDKRESAREFSQLSCPGAGCIKLLITF